jgi:hypothetical protein
MNPVLWRRPAEIQVVPTVHTAKAFIFLILVGCGGGQRKPDDPAIGTPVALVLPSADGDVVDLARFRGRVLVVHVALTGSLDSQSDVEELRRAREANRALALAELVFDDGGARLAVPWANASGIDWAVLLPSAAVRSGESPFGPIRVIPTTFVVGRDGRISWRWEGALPRGRLARAVQVSE